MLVMVSSLEINHSNKYVHATLATEYALVNALLQALK